MATTSAAWTRETLARAPQTYFDAVDAMDVDAVLDHFADDATLTVQTDHVTFTERGRDPAHVHRLLRRVEDDSPRDPEHRGRGGRGQGRRPSRATSVSCRTAR